MIARLHGRVAAIEDDAVVLDVGGVGYRVFVPVPVLADLGPEGSMATLATHLHVRENEMVLFGATDPQAIGLFQDLLSVSGVGPRVAMAMLSTFDVPTLKTAIVGEDVALLTEVPGVGRKTAQRLILDLKGRLEAAGVPVVTGDGAGYGVSSEDEETIAALTALGYSRGEARRALNNADVPPDATVEDRILASLRSLSG